MQSSNIIIENFTLQELKDFLATANLNTKYTCTPYPNYFSLLTTANGMDEQDSYRKSEVEAKFWIQYFPIADIFSFNINLFATLDGAPISCVDFLSKLPSATGQYEYYNSPKITWVRQGEVYVKDTPPHCPLGAFPQINEISKL